MSFKARLWIVSVCTLYQKDIFAYYAEEALRVSACTPPLSLSPIHCGYREKYGRHPVLSFASTHPVPTVEYGCKEEERKTTTF